MSRDSSNSGTSYAVPCGVTVRGTVRVPSSKSLTQRFFNLALLSDRPVELTQPLIAEDTTLFIEALNGLGMSTRVDGDVVSIAPRVGVKEGVEKEGGDIYCGNNGTMLRFLVGALTTVRGLWVLGGSPRLEERPIGALVDALRQLGARIDFLGNDGFAPVRLHGGMLGEGRVELDASQSSQFASSILMAASRAKGEIILELKTLTSAPYVDLTIAAMAEFGASVERLDSRRMKVTPAELRGGQHVVEPDFSSAAYPAAAALLTAGSVLIEGLSVTSKQGDRRFLEVLEQMGATVEWVDNGVVVSADGAISSLEIDLSAMPDQVPTLAALAPFAHGTTKIRNVGQLRFKESDRLAAMCEELRKLGAQVEEHPDGLTIEGGWARHPPPDSQVHVDSHGDHRIAMSLALLGLRRPGVVVDSPEVVAKSYPTFWQDLESLIPS